jgi:aspartyl-tRNA(Asn)/glutamyl-tRNA(Gln) amidotransferase subunit B
MGLSQISDQGELLRQIKEVIALFPQSVVDYKEGKDRALGFLVGQVMKKTGGKANPALTSKLVLEELKK